MHPRQTSVTERDSLAKSSYETVQLHFLRNVSSKLYLLGTMDPKDFLSEAHIMKRLRHPKLIQVWRGHIETKDLELTLNLISVICCLHFRGAHLHCHRTYEIWQPTRVSPGIHLLSYLFETLANNHNPFIFSGQRKTVETTPAD